MNNINQYIEYLRVIKSKISRTTLIFIGVVLLVLLLLQQCDSNASLRQEIKQVQLVADRELNNYKASLDTIKIERNKNNDLVAIKKAYEFDINTLTNDNKNLIKNYQSALNLSKDFKGINSLLKIEIRIKDSIINSKSNILYVNDTLSIINFTDEKNWDKYNWRRFSGNVGVFRNSKTNILSIGSSQFNLEEGIELKAAILKENGVSKLKISTPYPGVTFTNIENINLVNDKLNEKYEKKAGWSIGIGLGYGINLGNGVLTPGPSLNVGIIWSPKWLRF
jgi:hypothetical protein